MKILFAVGMATGCSKASPAHPDGSPQTPPADAPTATDVDDLTARAATAICSALYRCCDDDLVTYFAPYRDNERLAAFRDQLPPAATLDEPSCRSVVKNMLDIAPFGDWVHAVQHGDVEYDPGAFGRCIATLDSASCGAPARAALWDSGCFAFAPPSGGEAQRSFFHRRHGVGAACSPIRDGVGASFYGTCDPTTTFCCYTDPAKPGCQMPFDGAGNARAGTCAAVAATNATCAVTAPLHLCATGEDCDADSATCIAENNSPLGVGAACVDQNFQLLGICQDSWCDVLGSSKCEALREDNASCSSDEQCHSGRCSTVCIPNTLCTPHSPGTGADAGVDAPPVATAGETCSDAADLVTASSASSITGYASHVATTFGATNDYNPLKSGGLQPDCSLVYDARGKERVYKVTLAPGDRLRLRAELADGKRAGIYLLDSCPAATWPDFDASTLCGSNEYAVSACSITGCDPATLDIQYPTTLGGQPTMTKMFWVVVDQVDGSDSTGFALDWKIVH